MIGKSHIYAVSEFLLRNGLLFAEDDGAIPFKSERIWKQGAESIDQSRLAMEVDRVLILGPFLLIDPDGAAATRFRGDVRRFTPLQCLSQLPNALRFYRNLENHFSHEKQPL